MEDTAGARPETFSELLDLLSKLRLHEVTSPSQPRDSILFEKRPCHPSLTITVAPAGAADFQTLQDAVRSAKPGARILVRPGRYDECGIVFWDKGRGTVEECEIIGNRVAGVLIRTGGNPVIQRSRIRDGEMFGVMVDDHGSGTVVDCDISGNGVAGVQFLGAGSATIRQ